MLTTRISNNLITFPRIVKRGIMIIFDFFSISSALLLAFSLRYDYLYFPEILNAKGDLSNLFLMIIAAPIVAIPIFYSFGLYKSIIRYIGFKSLWSVGQAVSLYAVVWGLLPYMLSINGIPRSVILINWILSLFIIGGSRIFARWWLVKENYKSRKKRVVIYGAGASGRTLLNALNSTEDFKLVAFFDDQKALQGSFINGVEVLPLDRLEKLISDKKIDEIMLAMPSLSRTRQSEILKKLSPLLINVRIMPSMKGIADGQIKVEDLREINIGDLLGRSSVPPNKELLSIKVTNKVVMVTGAGGSIGSELCRQLIKLKPKSLILFEINEFALYKIHQELESLVLKNTKIFPILGSIRDKVRLENICINFKVQTIYHAAAYKHVPLVEHNNSEGVLNNIIGTMVLADIALNFDVETFVFISTDKAVRPTNTMGATKRVAELILQAFARMNHKTCFTMVRFGNVLDSSGSVIPLFRDQIKKGGPVTVTDINMVRYFMTIPEAIELVIQSGAMSNGGEVFVLDMGNPVKIYDLAVKMIELSGLIVKDKNRPDGDIEIKFTGLRPGEKLFEELLVGDNINKTDNPLIMSAEEDSLDWEILYPLIKKIEKAALDSNYKLMREILLDVVPEYTPQCDIEDYLYNVKSN